ncbi:hypothetical protein D9758_008125 [Tetrapyrgos nigripes]|uniref:Ubiquitin-activating enzyme SCCH domain-containing protein n=1 Tax=Tetrapyrgos nigripes TaxID=182062 RepID=A0A8H5GGZ9_9AGAR|nr:hypothetical protein D9758_008125 [Tetrapyrgos nigripes]
MEVGKTSNVLHVHSTTLFSFFVIVGGNTNSIEAALFVIVRTLLLPHGIGIGDLKTKEPTRRPNVFHNSFNGRIVLGDGRDFDLPLGGTQAGEETISFDKDDDDTLDFVTASSNLRSAAYGIEEKTRWEVKEMAGNIIPPIATTNAIVSGLIVLQALHLLRKSYDKLRSVHLQFKPSVPLSATTLSGPMWDLQRHVYVGVVVLADPDWDDNNERTLENLNVTRGKFLMIVDDGEVATIAVAIGALPPNHPVDAPAFILPDPVPEPPKKAKPAVIISTPPKTSLKRSSPDDDILGLEPTAKRQKSAMNQDISSPSKKRRLEEDGLIIMETADEKLEDDDVIVID